RETIQHVILKRIQSTVQDKCGYATDANRVAISSCASNPADTDAPIPEPDMGRLHDHRHPVQEDDLVAPIELVGFPGSKAQRDIGRGRCLAMLLGPSPGVAA